MQTSTYTVYWLNRGVNSGKAELPKPLSAVWLQGVIGTASRWSLLLWWLEKKGALSKQLLAKTHKQLRDQTQLCKLHPGERAADLKQHMWHVLNLIRNVPVGPHCQCFHGGIYEKLKGTPSTLCDFTVQDIPLSTSVNICTLLLNIVIMFSR